MDEEQLFEKFDEYKKTFGKPIGRMIGMPYSDEELAAIIDECIATGKPFDWNLDRSKVY